MSSSNYLTKYRFVKFGFSHNRFAGFRVLILLSYMCMGFLSGCFSGEEEVREALIQKMLELRKREYLEEELLKCKKDITAKAEVFVDSLIAAEISFRMSDSIIFPEKPLKPEFLGPVIVPDSAVAKPIF